MNTLFECWNGGIVEWDGLSSPRLSFSFAISSNDMLTFFLVSGRICQLMTRAEWQLSFAGKAYSIPPFPRQEMGRLLDLIPRQFGYSPVLHESYTQQDQEEYSIYQLRWAHLASGRVHTYAPFIGMRCERRRWQRKQPLVLASCDFLDVRFDLNGQLTGSGDAALVERLGLTYGNGYQSAHMLRSYFEQKKNFVGRIG